MSEGPKPRINFQWKDLPKDPVDRHEVLVDLFGQHVFWLRNWSDLATRRLGESKESRSQRGTIRNEVYEQLAELTDEQREVAYKLSEATVDRFIQLLLAMLAGTTGVDQQISNDHAIRFLLQMELLEVESHEVVDRETINRGGKKFLSDYYGRWLNRFK